MNYRAIQLIQIFLADGRTDERTNEGNPRGPRGPKNICKSVYPKYCYYHLVQMWYLKQLFSHIKYFLQGGLAAYAAFRILDDLINPDQVWLINYQSIASISLFSSSWIIFGIFKRLEVLQWTRHTRWERKPNDTHTGLMFSYKRLSLTFTNFHVLP